MTKTFQPAWRPALAVLGSLCALTACGGGDSAPSVLLPQLGAASPGTLLSCTDLAEARSALPTPPCTADQRDCGGRR